MTVRQPGLRLSCLAVAVLAAGALLAACSSGPGKSATTTTLPPLPSEVDGIVTLIGVGSAAGGGNQIDRIVLSSLPPELLPTTTVGTFPDAVAIAPDDKTAYVTNYESSTVTPIDLSTGKAKPAIHVGGGPAGIAIAPDGKTAYVTDAGSAPIGDTVTPIDLQTDRAESPITVGAGPQAIAISPDGKTAYVTDAGAVVTGQSGAIGDTVTPIDLSTKTALAPITVGNGPIGIAIDGGTAFVANSGSESVSPIDLATRSAAAAISVGGVPAALAADGGTVWVAVGGRSSSAAGSLVPIAVSSDTTGSAVTVGASPSAVAIAQHKAWVVCSGSIVPVKLSGAKPAAEHAVAVAGGPYALALYLVAPR